MANHRSAQKRARQNHIKRLRNKIIKTKVKNINKKLQTSFLSKSKDITKLLDLAKSAIDRAVKKGVLHKKTASRKISRLSRNVNSINLN